MQTITMTAGPAILIGAPSTPPITAPFSALSQREMDVVQQLVDGNSTDRGSRELYISCNTFRSHLKNISRKLDAHSSLEIVSLAVGAGMRPTPRIV